jgi:hypothetical protein
MAGRPTKYKPEYVEQVEKLCKLGATDKEIADFFEVSVDTVNEWKKTYPEFSVSLKAGKLIADAFVAESLYKRATGYKYEETTYEKIDIKKSSPLEQDLDEDDPITIDAYKRKVVTKELPPDSTAIIFWLKNRKPAQWRDKQEIAHIINEKQVMEIAGQKIEF